MPLLPRRVAGPRAWWLDVAVSLAAVGTAQAIVLGGDGVLQLLGRQPAGTPGFEAALVLERAPGTNGNTAVGLEPLTIRLDGLVDGLYPGSEGHLPLLMSNPTSVPITVERLTIDVGTPDREGCPADAILVGTPRLRGSGSVELALEIPPAGVNDLRVPIAMAQDAPSACQGATFPLRYTAEGALQ